MKASELVNRTNNLIATTIVALSGFAFLPEVFIEDDHADKLDDALLFILGLVAIYWYKKGQNRFQRTVMPVVLSGLALLIKIMGVVIEFHDKESLGDDLGGLILFLISFGFIWWLYNKNDKGLLDSNQH
ncbi:MAG: hypothetical protein P4L74_03575 [Candidatus Doudnabacteria bacterium]|nr:hypothetical protein [Candidatus Doudnabacteria bacterium]